MRRRKEGWSLWRGFYWSLTLILHILGMRINTSGSLYLKFKWLDRLSVAGLLSLVQIRYLSMEAISRAVRKTLKCRFLALAFLVSKKLNVI